MFFKRKAAVFSGVLILVIVIVFFLTLPLNVKVQAEDVILVETDMKHNFKDFSFEMIELTNDQEQNYFVNYRIKREQFRYETKKMLEPLLESDIRHTREEAQIRWLELTNKISKEDEIENTLKMRGFKDVIAEVNPEKVTVTLLHEDILIQEIFMVKNVVNDITGYEEDRIEILTKAMHYTFSKI